MKLKLFFLSIITLIITSCANKSVVSPYSSSLAGYKYAVIDDSKDRGGDASLMNFTAQVQQALQESHLKQVYESDIAKLSDEEKQKIIVLKLSGSQSHDNSVATINVTDYSTGRILGSCNGIFGLSFSTYGDMNGAIKKSVRAFKRLLKK